MAGAEIIASGIGILCLIIFGYVLIGGILSVGENAASAQNDFVLMKESQRETAIEIPPLLPMPKFNCTFNSSEYYPWKCDLIFNVTNTGTEMIGNFNQTDVYVYVPETGSKPPLKFDPTNISVGGNESDGTWSYIQISPDIIHPGMLDPNERMKVQINNFLFLNDPASSYNITVVTPNGVTDTYTK